jgi:hypothetical protein
MKRLRTTAHAIRSPRKRQHEALAGWWFAASASRPDPKGPIVNSGQSGPLVDTGGRYDATNPPRFRPAATDRPPTAPAGRERRRRRHEQHN